MARPRWRVGLVVFTSAGSRMAGPFDATLKQLLDACAADWLGWLAPLVGLPPAVEARVRAATDPARLKAALRQVLRVAAPDEITL